MASAIRNRYGVPKQEEHPTYIRYWFGGCSFVYYNQWDDPCLISNSAEGTAILKIIHDALNSPAE
ncbi:hypothetical protein [Rhizobium alvei]|uniref:hypothetical protein n=1 Tax=Rhizobium alvei TaxID=1132659 RepID=UPI0026E9F34C|nr:hypothetical protein [Rhizobium alvei]